MAIYAMGDLHFSGEPPTKPMEVFGAQWLGHREKVITYWKETVKEEDTVLLVGDISWSMDLRDAVEKDLGPLAALPGELAILKGNHDYWWGTATKMKKFFEAHGIESIDILFNNCFFYGDYALCGTRGWFYEEDAAGTHTGKMLAREALRLMGY